MVMLSVTPSLFAQSVLTVPSKPSDVFDRQYAATIPFAFNPLTSVGVVVQLAINGHKPMPFLIDTGVNLPVLFTMSAARKLGLKVGSKSRLVGGTDVRVTKGDAVQAVLQGTDENENVNLNFPSMFIADIGSLLSGTSEGYIAGIIGTPELASLAMQIDFVSHRLLLSPRPHGPLDIPDAIKLPMVGKEGIYSVILPVNGNRPTRMRIDIGSDLSNLPVAVLQDAKPSAVFVAPSQTVAGAVLDQTFLLPGLRIGNVI